MQMAAIGFQGVADLHREFARRREDQRAHAVRARNRAVLREALQQRQSERGGFAGSGLREAQHIAAFEDRGDCLRLDRCRVGVVLGGKRAQKRLAHAERLKGYVSHKKSLKHQSVCTRGRLLPSSTHIWKFSDGFFKFPAKQGA